MWVIALVPAALSLALRLWALAEERAANPLFTLAILDDRNYLDTAAKIAAGEAGDDAWFLAPLYPWLLATASWIGSLEMGTASLLAALFGAATTALLVVAAGRLHSRTAGVVAGLLHAAAGTFVFHEILPGQEPVLELLTVATFVFAGPFVTEGSRRSAFVVGLLGGVAMLGRATSLALPLAAAIVALRRPGRAGERALRIAPLVAGMLLVLLPAAIRNVSVVGDFTPFPWSGGVNLYMANGPDSVSGKLFGSTELGSSPQEMERNARAIAERAAGHELRPSELSGYWRERTIDELPGVGGTTAHLARKVLLFWSADEFGNNHYVEVERSFSTWLSVVPVTSWWLLSLALGGWWLVRPGRPLLDVVAVAVLLTWGALTVFYPVSRYRLPVLPLCVIAAACGLAEMALRARRPRLRVAVALTLVAAVAAHVPGWMDMVAGSPEVVHYNIATAYREQGRNAEAEEWLRQALAEDADYGPNAELLARVLIARTERGDGSHLSEALELLGRAERSAASHHSAGVAAVFLLILDGRAGDAESAARFLLERDAELTVNERFELDAYLAILDIVLRRDGRPAEAFLGRLAELVPEAATHPAVDRVRRALGPP
jgi:4-amino-4-deoxy-L-arabinose transferase-like glycosyltransferase